MPLQLPRSVPEAAEQAGDRLRVVAAPPVRRGRAPRAPAATWLGPNLLGFALMDARDALL